MYFIIRLFSLSVIDELIFVAPGVELTDVRADNLGGMLGCELSHCVEVNLLTCVAHIKMSERIFFIAFFVSSVMIFGPVM